MRIIPFPADEPLPGQEAWTASLEAALRGESEGPAPDAWRMLRDDVRALAPAITPAFQERLTQELKRRGALRAGVEDPRAASEGAAALPRRIAPGGASASKRGVFARAGRGRWSATSHRRPAIGAVATVAVALLAALLIVGSHPSPRLVSSPADTQSTRGSVPDIGVRPAHTGGSSPALSTPATPALPETPASSLPAVQASPSVTAAGAGGPVSAPGREQQLAASITLSSAPQNLQATSDQVAQLAARDGGYVQSSNVQVQQQGTSEATLALKLPSARLSAALAAIGRLAPVRAENQSLQDITSAYDAAHRQLRDAEAEQRALLRALAAATTEAKIESLRGRLAASRTAIARDQSSVNSLTARATTSEVEVTILGDTRGGSSEGLTIHKGLHDAGQVLLAIGIATVILAAALVPLALLLAGAAGARRGWRRHRREQALNSP
jgi:hypothetical protein